MISRVHYHPQKGWFDVPLKGETDIILFTAKALRTQRKLSFSFPLRGWKAKNLYPDWYEGTSGVTKDLT
jgi:hypothetical protein